MKQGSSLPIHKVAASSGLAWMLQSLVLLKRQAGPLLLIAVLMQLILGLAQLPLLGLLVVVSVPGLTAGILEAFHQSGRGVRPAIFTLFKPLATAGPSGSLLVTGFLVFIVGLLSISMVLAGLVESLDPDIVQRLEQGDMNAVVDLGPDTLNRIIMAFAVGMAVSGTLSYFTIPLIWFCRQKTLIALSTGIKALMRNWLAFLVLTLSLVVIALPLSFLGLFLLRLAPPQGLGATMAMGFILLLALVFQLLLFGTQYCAARQVFGLHPPKEKPPENVEDSFEDEPSGDDDQFVA